MLPLDEVQSAVEKLAFCMFNSVGSLCRDSREQAPSEPRSSPALDEFNEQLALKFANEIKEARNEIQMLLHKIKHSEAPSLQELKQQIEALLVEDSVLSSELLAKTKALGKEIIVLFSLTHTLKSI